MTKCEKGNILILGILLGGRDITDENGGFAPIPSVNLGKASKNFLTLRWEHVREFYRSV